MGDALLLGEAMALFVADVPGMLEEVENYTRTVSGAEVNVAIGLARLGFNASYLTRLGDDELGRFIKNFIRNENVNVDLIEFDPVNKTGIQLKSKVLKGDAVAPYFRKDSAASKITTDSLASINWSELKVLHITGIPLAISTSFRDVIFEAIRQAKQHNVYITFDPNIRPALWSSTQDMKETILSVAKQCDLFLPGMEEGILLTDQRDKDAILDAFSEQGITNIIMKMGPAGSYVLTDSQREFVEGFEVSAVVDTVGAGDGFATGVVSAILDGENHVEAARRGNAIGAIQVMHWSDNQGLPTRSQLEKFMQEGCELNNESN